MYVCSALATTKICKAQHVADTNHELAQVLFTRREHDTLDYDTKNKDGRPHSNTERLRKLARVQAVQQCEGQDGGAPIGVSGRYLYTVGDNMLHV